MNKTDAEKKRAEIRKELGIPEWVAGRGAKGWAKALAILIPVLMLTVWLIFGG